MFNPVNIGWLEIGGYNYIVISGMLPLTVAFIYNGFKTRRDGHKWVWYSLLTGLSSTVLLTQQIEMTVLVTAFIIMFSVVLLLKDVAKPRLMLSNLKFLLVTLVVSLGLNLWWITPLLSVYSSGNFVTATYSNAYFSQRLQTISGYPNILLQMFRMQYYSSKYLAAFIRGNLAQWITSPPNIIVGILFCCLVYLSLFLRRDSKIALFALSTAFFTAMATGLNPPLGSVYNWLWGNVTLFRVFNNPLKFLSVVLLGYSVLLGIAIAEISRRIYDRHYYLAFVKSQKVFKISLSKIFILLVVLLIAFNAYPLFSGNLGGVLEPAQIPAYYYQTRNWLQNQTGDFRIMMLPELTTGSYTWAPTQPAIYGMVPVSLDVFPTPVIDLIPARVQNSVSPVGSPELELENYVYNLIVNPSSYTFDQLYQPGLWVDNNFTEGWGFVQADVGVTSYNFSSIGPNMGAVETVTSQQATGIWYMKSVPSVDTDSFPYYVVQLRGDGVSEYVIAVYDSNVSIYNSGVQTSPNSSQTLIIKLPPGKNVTGIYLQAKCSAPGTARIYWGFVMFMHSLPRGSGIGKMLNLLNVKYLILSNDLADPITHDPISTSSIKDFLGNQTDIRLVKSFGELDIYENLDYEETQIYGSTNYVFISDTANTTQLSDYFHSVSAGSVNTTNVVALSQGSLPSSYFGKNFNLTTSEINDSSILNENPQLKYVQINPSEYKVYVNTSTPFVLVFSETYDSQWNLYVDAGQTIPNHSVANFYANEWYIQRIGNYPLTLYFTPQNYLNQGFYGTLASVIIVCILLIALVIFHIRRVHAPKSKEDSYEVKDIKREENGEKTELSRRS
jgi:hypothetical protein